MDSNDLHKSDSIDMPTPTGWPMLTAFGITLLLAGLVTNMAVSAVGLVVAIASAVGWFFGVFPHPKHEPVPLQDLALRPEPLQPRERAVDYLTWGEGGHRVKLPVEMHPYSAGIVGGLAGGAVMAVLAVIYGLVTQGSLWYTVNLLAAAALPSMAQASTKILCEFHIFPFIVAVCAHLSISIMVGLLYAVVLPMLPRKHTWLWGGVITPLLWTGLIYASIDIVNPALAVRIDWTMFICCQVAFGLVGGYIVFKSAKVETMQTWPLAAKMGVEAPVQRENEGEQK
ncbi:MAG: hypothetical protein ABI443_10265 [Chthoniobacterales bacterium]